MDLKKSQKIWIALVVLIFAVVGGYFLSTNVQKSGELGPASTTQKEQVRKIKASIVVNPGGGQDRLLGVQEVEIEEGKTALDLTREVAKVETSGEGQNAFVTAINGRTADSAKKEFWELLVNGKPAQVGAGSYVVKNGDKIEWRISKF